MHFPLLVLCLWAGALAGRPVWAQGPTIISFEVFSSPRAECVTTAPPALASFSPAFPAGTRPPRLYHTYAGSMPGATALDACQRFAAASSRTPVVLSPTFGNEVQGNLKILSVAGNCTASGMTPAKPLQFAVQLDGSEGAEDLGLISCRNAQVCHIYYSQTVPPSTEKASGCVYCGDYCRVVTKKGILLTTVSDEDKGPCCDGCSCKFSHYVQSGKLFNRVRYYYYTCQDPSCFPASATVEVAGRGRQPMSSVRIGAAVLTVHPKTGVAKFSEVYALPHRQLGSPATYLQVTDTNNRTLLVSAGHLVYSAAQPSHRLSDYTARPASYLRPGQYIWSQRPVPSTANGAETTTSNIGNASSRSVDFGPARVEHVVRTLATGKVAPFSLDGTLLVDGVLASSYATHGSLSADTAHTALAPLRWLWRVWPSALRALHSEQEGSSPALLAAGLHVLDAAQRMQALVASV